MLQEDQRTSAPSSINVSIRTAVWIVICRQPAIRAPARGLEGPYFRRSSISPGISFSAIVNSFRPQSAKLISAKIEELGDQTGCYARASAKTHQLCMVD